MEEDELDMTAQVNLCADRCVPGHGVRHLRYHTSLAGRNHPGHYIPTKSQPSRKAHGSSSHPVRTEYPDVESAREQ